MNKKELDIVLANTDFSFYCRFCGYRNDHENIILYHVEQCKYNPLAKKCPTCYHAMQQIDANGFRYFICHLFNDKNVFLDDSCDLHVTKEFFREKIYQENKNIK